ncbi:MAG: response regulator [Bacteroidia bacterium]
MIILLVEDNPGDVRLTQEAFKEGNYYAQIDLRVVSDGEEALKYLRKQGKYEGVPTPDIIFLDLNLPRKEGKEVLREIKSDKDLCVIPVVILTTSEAANDIMEVYRYHANCYITKPVDINHFINVIKSIENFWFSVVTLPTRAV